jgi:hypothetical protein
MHLIRLVGGPFPLNAISVGSFLFPTTRQRVAEMRPCFRIIRETRGER